MSGAPHEEAARQVVARWAQGLPPTGVVYRRDIPPAVFEAVRESMPDIADRIVFLPAELSQVDTDPPMGQESPRLTPEARGPAAAGAAPAAPSAQSERRETGPRRRRRHTRGLLMARRAKRLQKIAAVAHSFRDKPLGFGTSDIVRRIVLELEGGVHVSSVPPHVLRRTLSDDADSVSIFVADERGFLKINPCYAAALPRPL